MLVLQDLIHSLEEGAGARYLRLFLGGLFIVFLVVIYDLRAYKNMASLEAMDAAQVGRNLAQGKGFTTLFVRPFSLFLLARHGQRAPGPTGLAPKPDLSQVQGLHPDLATAPVYPLALAGLMKILPFRFSITEEEAGFWRLNGRFWRYQPDFYIAIFNQILFLLLVLAVYALARALFDNKVALFSGFALLGTDVFWRFSVSGLSTMFLLLIFVGLAWALVLLEGEVRKPTSSAAAVYFLATVAGFLTGVGTLTRYSFGVLILPVLVFAVLVAVRRRLIVGGLTLLAFTLLLAPWIARNFSLSGTPFGTAGFALIENSFYFPTHQLERSLQPDLKSVHLVSVIKGKLITNGSRIIQTEFPKLGGSWLGALFLGGLLTALSEPTTRRLRWFLLGAILVLGVAEALGRTQLSEDAPDINTESLLVLAGPLVIVYAVGFFLKALGETRFAIKEMRSVVLGGFGLITILPLLLSLLTFNPAPAYPPYFPPALQRGASFAKPGELTMSDIPWAMAWYGQRPCVWLTLEPRNDFFAIYDAQTPIVALFIAQLKSDPRLEWQFLAGDPLWDGITFQIVQSLGRFMTMEKWAKWPKQLNLAIPQKDAKPASFPLQNLQDGWPNQLLLTVRPFPERAG